MEIVRRGYEAFDRGEVTEMLSNVDPEAIIYRELPDGATYQGPEGLVRAIAEWVEDFDDFNVSAEEFIDANDHQVVVRVHQTAVGAQSGAPIEATFWFVHTLSDARVTRLDMLTSKAKALEAAGLSE